jgi:hypothetical protein
MAFSTEASDQTGGLAFVTQPVIRLIDAGGNTAGDATGSSYTVVLTSSPSGELFGTVDIEPSSGVATFSGIGLNTAESYTLTATRGTLTVTDTVVVTAGPAASLNFTTQPSVSGNEGGAVLGTTPVVTLFDAGGNVAPASSVITISIQSGPTGGALVGDVDVASSSGVTVFTDLGSSDHHHPGRHTIRSHCLYHLTRVCVFAVIHWRHSGQWRRRQPGVCNATSGWI